MANKISGSQTIGGVKVGTTHGTAVQAAAGDRLSAEFTSSFNAQELIARSIGSGGGMRNNATFGTIIPTIGLTMDAGYRNQTDKFLAQFMGVSGAPSEVTGGQGDYKHTITLEDEFENLKPLSIGWMLDDAVSIEAPSAYVQTVTLATKSVPGYVDFSCSALCDQLRVGTTNTVSNLGSTTFTEGTPVLASVAPDDYFKINAQSAGDVGAASAFSILSFSMTLNRPMEVRPEIRGSAGYGAPVSSGDFNGNITVTLSGYDSTTYNWVAVFLAETELKARFSIQGAAIGSGTNKEIEVFLPRMKLVKDPVYNVTSSGTNPVTLTFELLAASSNPTSMSSTFPYFEITNTLSTSLLA